MIAIGLILVGSLGLVLLIIGLRGWRIDDHPWCRKCRYDLSGLDEPTACPECGADLTRRRAVRIGQRRKRPIVISLASLMLAMSIAGGGFIAADVDWTPHKPVWLLIAEANHRGPADADAALDEMLRRLNDDLLSMQEINRIADAALRAQADFESPWNTKWGDFIEAAWLTDRLDRERIEQYCRTAFGASFSIEARVRIQAGTRLPVRLRTSTPRTGSPHYSADTQWIIGRVHLEEPLPLYHRLFHRGALMSRSGLSSRNLGFDLSLAPGRHRIPFRCRVIAVSAPADSHMHSEHHAAAVLEWTVEIPIEVEVVDANEPTVALRDDPALADPIRNAITIELVQPRLEDRWNVHRGGLVLFRHLPISVSFDVYARHDGTEERVGSVRASEQPMFGDATSQMLDVHATTLFPEAQTVDLIFRTNPEHAEKTIDIYEVWDGEIVIENVPIR